MSSLERVVVASKQRAREALAKECERARLALPEKVIPHVHAALRPACATAEKERGPGTRERIVAILAAEAPAVGDVALHAFTQDLRQEMGTLEENLQRIVHAEYLALLAAAEAQLCDLLAGAPLSRRAGFNDLREAEAALSDCPPVLATTAVV